MVGSVNDPLSEDAKGRLTDAGDELADEIRTEVDGAALSDAAGDMAQALANVSSLTHEDLSPTLETEYETVAARANDLVSNLILADFFETADEVLPPFDPDFLEDCLAHAVGTAEMEPFETAGVGSELPEFVDEALSHTEAIEQNVRWEPEKPNKVSPMTTRGATEGVVDWLDDLGRHLWMSEVLLSEQMLEDAETHTRAMGSALLLLAQGVAGLDHDESNPEDDVARIVGGIALHTHHQRRLPEDLSWITDEMRAPGGWA
ncbi:hypothetical protein BRC94_07030 [Halobacteriales archaeon QS_5_70_17]|nr:MAG: hypothetical protein BRC94_07030 [Halobacteriales archaeon QS_5_70_17]